MTNDNGVTADVTKEGKEHIERWQRSNDSLARAKSELNKAERSQCIG